jgi:hypothetical protein
MDICFIDSGLGIDRRARKTIRSHVMKGKNAGRSIIGRGKKNAATASSSPGSLYAVGSAQESSPDPRLASLEQEVANQDQAKADRDQMVLLPRRLTGNAGPHGIFSGRELTYFDFPVVLSPSMRRVLHQCELLERLLVSAGTMNHWFQSMITNQGCTSLSQRVTPFERASVVGRSAR